MEYIAEDYIKFIEMERYDKISQHGLKLIATEFRKLQESSKSKLPCNKFFADFNNDLICANCGKLKSEHK